MTYLLVAGLAFLIVALGWAFFFWGQLRRLSPAFVTFLTVDAFNLSFILFRHSFPDAIVRTGALVMAVAMIAAGAWLLTDLWKNRTIVSS